MGLVKIKLDDAQAQRFFGIPRQRNSGRVILSQDLDFRAEIHVWCREFLVEGAQPYWDVSTQSYYILFRSQDDVFSFKMRWW
ncbi:MAG: hypothetical protein EOP84_24700 [Verrucomicrobiaceae bacterium]|nr:MAG: hypothetical protein EOP84_24700 [Verrucomicrobiaceae bacterium]